MIQQEEVSTHKLTTGSSIHSQRPASAYFHDGRYANYAQVVAHFDREFYLGLSAQDRQDLVAYLQAVGDGEQPTMPDSVDIRLLEISDFMAVLESAISEHNTQIAGLAADTIDRELRNLSESFPEPRNASVTGGARRPDND